MEVFMNVAFKLAIVERWGSATEFCKAVGISEGPISQLVRGHRYPRLNERAKLRKIFSHYEMRKFWPPKAPKVEGERAINAN
jgi:hypothetical protein